jgi:hypothetical protein
MFDINPQRISIRTEARFVLTDLGRAWFLKIFTHDPEDWVPLADLLDAAERLDGTYAVEYVEAIQLRPEVPSRPLTRAELEQVHRLNVERAVADLNRLILRRREAPVMATRIRPADLALGGQVAQDAWEMFRLAGWDVCSTSTGEVALTPPAAEDSPAEVVPEGATCAENELDAAWAATGVAGQVRSLTTLADVVATHRSEVLAYRALRAIITSLINAGENFRPGDVEDLGAWVDKTVRQLRAAIGEESPL